MHISDCLDPKKIYNPYTKCYIMAPCGKCAACTNAKSALMVERLDVEATCWTFQVFGTITYAPESLPVAKYADPYLIDLDPKRAHWKLGSLCVNVPEELHLIHTSRDDNAASYSYIKYCSSTFGGLPYLSSVDFQRFIKRLRSLVVREFKKAKKNNLTNETNIPQIRYYLCGEYGPTSYRPHGHFLLFFNSSWLATYIHEFLRKCWQFGFVDSSFVEHSAAHYVAAYVNGISNLPAIYKTRSLRPFALFSKHPALGTLIYRSSDLCSMFSSKTLEQIIWRQRSNLFDTTRLWRSLRDKLYPRLSFFDYIDNCQRVKLYGIYNEFCEKDYFDNIVAFTAFLVSHKSDYIRTYLELLRSFKGDFDLKVQRWYRISRRVCLQANIFGVSVREYVSAIVDFYSNVSLKQLSDWYRFSEDYTLTHSAQELLCFDPLFVHDLLDCDIADLSYDELSYLQSFGLDLNLFFHEDWSVRQAYQMRFFPQNTEDFILHYNSSVNIRFNSTKTKKKNDYEIRDPLFYLNRGIVDFSYNDFVSSVADVPFSFLETNNNHLLISKF